jgi:hypothetical protein
MTRTFVPLRRIAALSVALTLFAAPIAAAQSPETAPPPIAAPANTVLLSSAAFARLVQPPPADVAPAPVVADPPRTNLLRPVVAARARVAPAAPAPAPQRRSWVARHKVATVILIGVGAFFGVVALCYAGACGDD